MQVKKSSLRCCCSVKVVHTLPGYIQCTIWGKMRTFQNDPRGIVLFEIWGHFWEKKNRGFPFIILFMICKKKMFRVCFSLHYYVNFYRVHVHSNKTVRLIYNLRDNPVSSILVYIMFYKMFQKHKSHIHSQMHCLYCCKEVID